MYPRFWRFATYFTGLWVVYGLVVFIRELVVDHHVDWQPLYLIGGMGILLYQSREEYKKAS